MKDHTSEIEHLQALARLIRYYCVNATSTAHSGHLTSSLSATDLMTALVFGGTFRFKVNEPDHPNNDRLIFSKGHASPLFYFDFVRSVVGVRVSLVPSNAYSAVWQQRAAR